MYSSMLCAFIGLTLVQSSLADYRCYECEGETTSDGCTVFDAYSNLVNVRSSCRQCGIVRTTTYGYTVISRTCSMNCRSASETSMGVKTEVSCCNSDFCNVGSGDSVGGGDYGSQYGGGDQYGQGQGGSQYGQGQGQGQGGYGQGQGQGGNPYGQGQGGNPYGQGQGGNPYGQGQGQGQGQGANPYGQGQGGSQYDQYGGQGQGGQGQGQGQGQGWGNDPYGQGADPYGSQQGQNRNQWNRCGSCALTFSLMTLVGALVLKLGLI